MLIKAVSRCSTNLFVVVADKPCPPAWQDVRDSVHGEQRCPLPTVTCRGSGRRSCFQSEAVPLHSPQVLNNFETLAVKASCAEQLSTLLHLLDVLVQSPCDQLVLFYNTLSPA